jgi:hypothetical protein
MTGITPGRRVLDRRFEGVPTYVPPGPCLLSRAHLLAVTRVIRRRGPQTRCRRWLLVRSDNFGHANVNQIAHRSVAQSSARMRRRTAVGAPPQHRRRRRAGCADSNRGPECLPGGCPMPDSTGGLPPTEQSVSPPSPTAKPPCSAAILARSERADFYRISTLAHARCRAALCSELRRRRVGGHDDLPTGSHEMLRLGGRERPTQSPAQTASPWIAARLLRLHIRRA